MMNKWKWGVSGILGLALTLGSTLPTYAVQTLYGVSLNAPGIPRPSSLYTIDPVTGAGTLVGNIGYGVNSLAVDPTTGKLYGATTTWSGSFNGLLEINPLTGAGTEIGAFDGTFNAILGLTFNSAGELYGWHEPSASDLVRINVTTGAATTVGDAGISTGAHVLAFDNANNLRLVQGPSVYNINTSTGAANFQFNLSFDPGAAGADFDPMTGRLWASLSPSAVDARIRVTDFATHTFTDIDTNISYLSALTFGETNPVPEPGTILLMGSGLASMFGYVWRKRKQQNT